VKLKESSLIPKSCGSRKRIMRVSWEYYFLTVGSLRCRLDLRCPILSSFRNDYEIFQRAFQPLHCKKEFKKGIVISKTTTFLSELIQTCASLRKPKKSASHKLNQLGQIFDKFMLQTSSMVPHSQYEISVSFRMYLYA
jgi:hypothetical protein